MANNLWTPHMDDSNWNTEHNRTKSVFPQNFYWTFWASFSPVSKPLKKCIYVQHVSPPPTPLNSLLPSRHFLLHLPSLLDICPAQAGNLLGQGQAGHGLKKSQGLSHSLVLGDGGKLIQPKKKGNPYKWGPINPYYWVEFPIPLLYGKVHGSLDPTRSQECSTHPSAFLRTTCWMALGSEMLGKMIQLPSLKLTACPWKSPSFLVNAINMVDFLASYVSFREGAWKWIVHFHHHFFASAINKNPQPSSFRGYNL